ncbi:hypothetical protein AAVH_39482, partial [Aphelenchoides avenae]
MATSDTIVVYPLDEDMPDKQLIAKLRLLFDAFGTIVSIRVQKTVPRHWTKKFLFHKKHGRVAIIQYSYSGMACNAVGMLNNK